MGGPTLDLVISGGRALSRGLDQPRDRAAGKKEPASRHMRVTIPSAEPVARSCLKAEHRICCTPLGASFETRASATETTMRKASRIVSKLSSASLT